VILPIYPVETTLPQRPPMMLIDQIVARETGKITVSMTVHAKALFYRPGQGMPVHVALEWMAQACAAYAGSDARDGGGVPRLGFLLGTRDFRATRAWFAEGERLYVGAQLDYHDEDLARFSCGVAEVRDGPAVVQASLTVFHPRDATAVIGRVDASP
jgi:predicted hotdog family 3-hydroxylacyl-ACP dehydratase